ncbi:uncharacterized protein HD556DRAFT_7946 [Suillus plorans]|uniref:Uncharacterized protein n=1 Tax=Suillus plorans TaxID=116603 RepID=A0A9P7E379_9AGAM|nr:uncharacterized protein HD556DRAFT_7946 [Suillus plorans]KAG1809832.1 hypothetical protein HD556DRAFT_7946 [Suillus plorans]
MMSLCFYRFLPIIPYISTILAAQVQPARRNIVSPAACVDGYSWMDDSQGDSPCLTAAYVEGACTENNYNQPVLQSGYSYSLPNSSTANPCYCSWSSYNLMMACTLCQGVSNSSVSEWPAWASGCTTNQSWTQEYFPPGYMLTGGASIPYWATTDPSTWTYATFNIPDANATYQKSMLSSFYLFITVVDPVQILLVSPQAPHRHLAVQVQAHLPAVQVQARSQLTWVQ